MDCRWAFDDHQEEMQLRALVRIPSLSRVASTFRGFGSRTLPITAHALIERVVNYGLMVLGAAIGHYAVGHYAAGHYAAGHYAVGHYAVRHYAVTHYAVAYYAVAHYAVSHYAGGTLRRSLYLVDRGPSAQNAITWLAPQRLKRKKPKKSSPML